MIIHLSKQAGVKTRINLKDFERVAEAALRGHRAANREIELHLVKSSQMKVLNFKFRNKNYPTDVLSFEHSLGNLLGSIVIDVQTAAKQAKDYKHSTLREVQELFVHGLCHLLGYDHELPKDAQRMASVESRLNRLWTSAAIKAKLKS
jgi:probable rRNA maturation factor